MTGRSRSVLARRIAVVAALALFAQLAVGLGVHTWFSLTARRTAISYFAKGLDDFDALQDCTDRPGPWNQADGLWIAWPADREGRLIGQGPPVRFVERGRPGQIDEQPGPNGLLIVYTPRASGCGAVVVLPGSRFPALRAISGKLFWLGVLRIGLLGLVTVVVVAITAWPLVRRIRAMATRMSEVVQADFVGQVNVGDQPDELGELAEAFDLAAATARERLVRLEHRDEVLRRALADLAHDLRTPLATLKLSASGLPPSHARSTIRAELEFLDGMAQNFEAILGGDEPDLSSVVALEPIVDQLRLRFAPLAEDRGLSLDVSLPDRSPRVRVESIGLARAVGNLLQNALRWASSHVVVVVFTQGDDVRIEVRDDGPGIGEAPMRAVARGVRGATSRGEGFGLGLAIAEATARHFGGRLELANGAEGGTCATIVLPMVKPE